MVLGTSITAGMHDHDDILSTLVASHSADVYLSPELSARFQACPCHPDSEPTINMPWPDDTEQFDA